MTLSTRRQALMLCISTSLEWPIRVDMHGVIHSTNLQIKCLQRIGDGSKILLTLRLLQFLPRFPSFRWIYLSLLCAIVRKTVKFLASVVFFGKPIWFFVKVNVCASIMVIGVWNRQTENDLKNDYQDAFKNDTHFNSEFYFNNQNTLQKYNWCQKMSPPTSN